MVPLAGPDCLSVSLCQVALQSEWRRRRCQWSGEVTAVTSALPGGARQDKGVRPPLR
jgi:hypothetical protein